MATTYYAVNMTSSDVAADRTLQRNSITNAATSFSVPKNSTQVLVEEWIVEPGNSDNASWGGSGSYLMTVNISTANTNITLFAKFVRYRDDGTTVVQTSGISTGASAGATGNASLGSVTWNPDTNGQISDRFTVQVLATNGKSSAQSFALNLGTGTTVAAPFTAPVRLAPTAADDASGNWLEAITALIGLVVEDDASGSWLDAVVPDIPVTTLPVNLGVADAQDPANWLDVVGQNLAITVMTLAPVDSFTLSDVLIKNLGIPVIVSVVADNFVLLDAAVVVKSANAVSNEDNLQSWNDGVLASLVSQSVSSATYSMHYAIY